MCERLQTVLHTKPEDLRLYDLTDLDSPELLDEEEKTAEEMGFKDGHSLLVESRRERERKRERRKREERERGPSLFVAVIRMFLVRNRDNSWPEELIAMFREVQEKDDSKAKQKQGKASWSRLEQADKMSVNLSSLHHPRQLLTTVGDSYTMNFQVQ